MVLPSGVHELYENGSRCTLSAVTAWDGVGRRKGSLGGIKDELTYLKKKAHI